MILFALVLAATPPPERSFPVAVVSVHDGDTVRLDVDLGFGTIMRNQSVRLRGIDAPELNTDAGKRAREVLGHYLHRETVVLFVIPGHERDKYGRILGRLVVDPCGYALTENRLCDVGDRMIRDGHAVFYDGGTR